MNKIEYVSCKDLSVFGKVMPVVAYGMFVYAEQLSQPDITVHYCIWDKPVVYKRAKNHEGAWKDYTRQALIPHYKKIPTELFKELFTK